MEERHPWRGVARERHHHEHGGCTLLHDPLSGKPNCQCLRSPHLRPPHGRNHGGSRMLVSQRDVIGSRLVHGTGQQHRRGCTQDALQRGTDGRTDTLRFQPRGWSLTGSAPQLRFFCHGAHRQPAQQGMGGEARPHSLHHGLCTLQLCGSARGRHQPEGHLPPHRRLRHVGHRMGLPSHA